MGAEGGRYKHMCLLEVMCDINQLAHPFALGGLTRFLSKNFLKLDTGDVLAWEQEIKLLTAM